MRLLALVAAIAALAAAGGAAADADGARLAAGVAAAAAAAPVFLQALAGDADWAQGKNVLGGFGGLVASCTKGELIPSRRAPAAAVLPSLKVTLTAGACVAAPQPPSAAPRSPSPRGSTPAGDAGGFDAPADAGGKGIVCEPFVTAYRVTPPLLLPPRTTPAGAVGPACSLRAALGPAASAPAPKVLLAPALVECDSLADLAAGRCRVTQKGGAGRADVLGDKILAAMTEALGLPAAA